MKKQKERTTMTYDFTTVMDRRGKDALAVDVIPFEGAEVAEGFDRIPMWVADMNFATVPTIQEHIINRVNHPAYGYFEPSKEYYDSINEPCEIYDAFKFISTGVSVFMEKGHSFM